MTVEGAEIVARAFKNMPGKLQKRVVRKAVNAAANPVLKAARAILKSEHVGEKPITGRVIPQSIGAFRKPRRKRLWQTMRKKVKTYRKSGNIYAIIGPEALAAPHKHLVHGVVKKHRIPMPKGGIIKLKDGRRIRVAPGAVLKHPGYKGDPFMLRAFISTASRQKALLASKMRQSVEKELSRP